MFGAVPGNYKNPDAAFFAGAAYANEEGVTWTVVYKELDTDIRFCPCRATDISEAIHGGWETYTDLSPCERHVLRVAWNCIYAGVNLEYIPPLDEDAVKTLTRKGLIKLEDKNIELTMLGEHVAEVLVRR